MRGCIALYSHQTTLKFRYSSEPFRDRIKTVWFPTAMTIFASCWSPSRRFSTFRAIVLSWRIPNKSSVFRRRRNNFSRHFPRRPRFFFGLLSNMQTKYSLNLLWVRYSRYRLKKCISKELMTVLPVALCRKKIWSLFEPKWTVIYDRPLFVWTLSWNL